MKNTKWIWRVLAVVLTLVVLAGVGLAGVRVGMMKSAALADGTLPNWHSSDEMQKFNGDFPHGDNSNMRGFDHGHDFGGRSSNRGGRDGFSFFSPIFGLIRLAVLGGLIWLGYTFVKRSGWRLVNVNANQAAPTEAVVEETPAAKEDEKKDEA